MTAFKSIYVCLATFSENGCRVRNAVLAFAEENELKNMAARHAGIILTGSGPVSYDILIPGKPGMRSGFLKKLCTWKREHRKKSLFFILLTTLLLASFFSVYAEDIVILYTNDVHCGYDDNLGFSSLAALKDFYKTVTPNVLLVDSGDAVQGDVIGVVSHGEFIIDFMNEVGYDYATLGNHEFDYGLDRLAELAEMADFTYVDANIAYTGTEGNKLEFLKPYAVHDFGDVKVGFVGAVAPETITSTTPGFFKENGEFVYNFGTGEKGAVLAGRIQDAVDACKAEGADYVILLSHLGIDDDNPPYRSIDVINKTHDIDACLDAHSHSVITSKYVVNDRGELIPLSSTGTKLQNIGILVITDDGILITTLVNGDLPKSAEFDEDAAMITATFEEMINEVMAHSNVDLRITDESGIRMSRTRETNLGDFVADAYRRASEADIAFVNGGGLRSNLKAGDLTYADIMTCHPFGNEIVAIKVTGQQILDALEWGARIVQPEYKDAEGKTVGENGQFLHVSGLRFTIDTSVETPVISDTNGMFFGMIEDAPHRVSDVEVERNGEWVPIDPEAEYILGGHNYMLLEQGGGFTMFDNAEVVLDSGIPDYQVLVNRIVSFDGDLSAYAEPQGRITIK